jgi:hypothetical protein
MNILDANKLIALACTFLFPLLGREVQPKKSTITGWIMSPKWYVEVLILRMWPYLKTGLLQR